jgi:hypothetical protein
LSREPLSRLILQGAIGFAIGLTLWIAASRPYDDLLAAAAGPILRRIEPSVTWVRTVDARIAVDRTDLPSRTIQVEVRLFTFNMILLFTLFATNARPLSVRNLGRLAISWGILALTQVVAVTAAAESVFSHNFGNWSDAHYSGLATDASLAIAQGYMLVGGYAVVFALWWVTRGVEMVSRGDAETRRRERHNS